MNQVSSGHPISSPGRQCLLFMSIVLSSLGFIGALPARAEQGFTQRACASVEPIVYTVDHQKSIRVCSTLPVHISLWNGTEERKAFLEKVVVTTSSERKATEFQVLKELLPAKNDLDEFCRTCAGTMACGAAEPCGELYSALQSAGHELAVDIPLTNGRQGAVQDDACIGEEIDIEAHLVIGGQPTVLRRTLTIEEGGLTERSTDGPARVDETGTVIFTGRLPHPSGWFAGDQHSHTSYERDAGFCIWEWPDSMGSMISAARSMDLNWQIFTDHSFGIDGTIWSSAYTECTTYNAQHPGDTYRCLYGEEVSTGNRSGQFTISHYLELPKNSDNVGFYADGCSWLCNSCKAEQTVINDINTKGGMGFIAHPYDTDFSWVDWSATAYRGLEALNSLDGTWGAEDESSLGKWASLLSEGRNVVGLSDSDAHYAADVGYSFTYCELSELSTAAIRAALAGGRCVFGNGPLVTLEVGGKKLGDTLAACPGSVTVSIDAYRGDTGMGYLDTIGIYVNGFLRDELAFAENVTEYHGSRTLNLTGADRYLFLKLQNRGASKTYKAYTNPLWLDISAEHGRDDDGDTYTTCENDCNDNDAAVHPGAPELCDGKDNDCDGTTDEGFVTPGPAAGLVFGTNKQMIGWNVVPLADRYDIVKGDLQALRSSGGDFGSTLQACLEDDSPDAQSGDSLNPASGQGFYYLVRAQKACMSGTFNTENPGQTGDRDPGIESSPHRCP